MEHTFIVNGDVRLVLIPSNEAERLLINQLTQGDVEILPVSDKVNILGSNLSGGFVVRRKEQVIESAQD